MAINLFPSIANNHIINIPNRLDGSSLNNFLANANLCMSRGRIITFDFKNLNFIEPIGVAALISVIEYAKTNWVVDYINTETEQGASSYLHAINFISHIKKQNKTSYPNPKKNYIPLNIFRNGQYTNYLYNELSPWLQEKLKLHPETTESIRVNLEEAYLNIRHHSGINSGCTFVQFYPKLNIIRFAISDWGRGIPAQARKYIKLDQKISDANLLSRACDQGFSIKSDQGNRGYGLFNLTKYFVRNNGGNIFLKSDLGELMIRNSTTETKPAHYGKNVSYLHKYYGTLLSFTLRTDRLIDQPMTREDLKWT